MKFKKMSQWNLIKLSYITYLFVFTQLYVYFFYDNLIRGEWLEVGLFTRIVIPDTFKYLDVIDSSDLINSLFFSGIKNSVGPSSIWYLFSYNWYLVSFYNIILVYFIINFSEKLLSQYSINTNNNRLVIIKFALSPIFLYYSIGSLKELPIMLCSLMFMYYFNCKRNLPLVLVAILMVIFRYQFLFIFLSLYLLSFFKYKPKLTLIYLIICSSLYPLITKIGALANSATEIYREDSMNINSIGSIVESIRSDIPILSTLAIFFRVLQSLFEPMFTFINDKSLYENGYINIFLLFQFISLILFLPYLFKFLHKFYLIIFKNINYYNHNFIFSFLSVSITFTGGFSFIHHRYLFPFFALILIASFIPKYKTFNFES